MIVFSLLFISFSFSSMAQRGAAKRERIQALKVAFITEELQLTSEQAKVFWPVYDQLEEELSALRRQSNRQPDLSAASDKEIENWVLNKLDLEAQQAALKKTYIGRFKEIITWQQIATLLQVEKRFKKELLQRIQERRGASRGR
jgi:hypothetical protein